ncbi:glycoside hydrolase family 3 N-terminal domain-containing protein [Actinomadura sp. DC4]|uniref:glycoside hydrolase family 3 protein n=1 Tax=Actinomadura sp. DC4 TaxID=3055069 RepID=UPI0025AED696|nr:glycoside hydrolase family 3 N-terminal domain-containing protein [Actinomadura sp. DC4]MDN3355565.1 glycoside hydrolase family 3 N-terminal domain-containing protein [Actinomadura sp. DC4]
MLRIPGWKIVSALAAGVMALSACHDSGAAAGPSQSASSSPPAADTPSASSSPESALVKKMSVQEKVGQLFMPTITGDTAAPGAALVKRYHLGGVIYFPLNLKTPRQTAELSNGLQKAALKKGGIPLVISTDEEQGPVSRLPYITRFASNKLLASTEHPDEDVRLAAKVTGEELRAVGINQDNAPDADVNINPNNPVIGVRSFGADPKKVAHLVGVAIDAYRATGVAVVAKHFPGHGDTATDSHTGLPIINHSKARWESVDAPPFKTAIAHHADVIMTAHIVVPGLDKSRLPATMSKTVLTGLLRDKLGFKGVTITDSLQMTGATIKFGPEEAAVRAVVAGADMLLMPRDLGRAYNAVLAAVKSGRISRGRLDDAVTRIIRMKKERGMFHPYVDAAKASHVIGSKEHRAAAAKVAADVRSGS